MTKELMLYKALTESMTICCKVATKANLPTIWGTAMLDMVSKIQRAPEKIPSLRKDSNSRQICGCAYRRLQISC